MFNDGYGLVAQFEIDAHKVRNSLLVLSAGAASFPHSLGSEKNLIT